MDGKLVTKQAYEEKLSEITKKVLNIEKLKETKEEKLVEHNFSKDFLMELPKDGNVVLSLGINPGGGNEYIVEKEKTKDSIFFLENLDKKEEEELSIFSNVYVFNYYKPNYQLFEGIGAKAHWAMEGYLEDNEIEKMISNSKKKKITTNYNKERIIELIRKMQRIEREKDKKEYNKKVYVLFGDLLWYADGNQRNVEIAASTDENLNTDIKEIIELNIKYYKPKLIVITNAKASHWVKEALKEEEKDNNKYEKSDVIFFKGVPIILASMVSGRRPMDEFSKFRLKERIKEYYKE